MSELRWILLASGIVLLLGIFLWGRRSRGQAAIDEFDGHGRMDPPMSQPVAGQVTAQQGDQGEVAQPVANRWREEEWTSTVTDLPEIRLDALQAFDDSMAATPDEEDLLLPSEEGIIAGPTPSERHFGSQPAVERTPPKAAFEHPRSESMRQKPKSSDKRKIVALRLSAVLPERYAGSELRTALENLGLTHGKYGIFHRSHKSGTSILSVASMVEPGAFDLTTMRDARFAGITIFSVLPGPLPAAQTCDQLFDCARQLEDVLGGALHDERGQLLTAQRATAIRDEVLDFEHLLGSTQAGPAD